MKKILFIITTLKRCGPVNILFDIVKYLDPSTHKAHVLTLCKEEGESRWSDFEALGATVTCLNVDRGFSFAAALLHFGAAVDRIGPDVVHTIGFRADVLGALRLGKYRKLSSQLNYPFDDYVMTYGASVGGAMAHLTAWALKRYDVTVACANDVATKMAARGVPSRVIYNAIDETLFMPAPEAERQALRGEFGVPSDSSLVFIFVGVLSDRKQPQITLRAFLRFQQKHPQASLLVLGDGPLSQDCRELAMGNQRVIFAGNVAATRPYLAASDVYIATSKAEGMPVSVVEALAMRLPVVLSDINPHREILAIDAGAGFLAQTGSVDDTLRAMEQIADADLNAIGHHARQIIERELSSRVMSGKFQAIYAELCN